VEGTLIHSQVRRDVHVPYDVKVRGWRSHPNPDFARWGHGDPYVRSHIGGVVRDVERIVEGVVDTHREGFSTGDIPRDHGIPTQSPGNFEGYAGIFRTGIHSIFDENTTSICRHHVYWSTRRVRSYAHMGTRIHIRRMNVRGYTETPQDHEGTTRLGGRICSTLHPRITVDI